MIFPVIHPAAGHDRRRHSIVEEPTVNIDLMRPEIDNGAATKTLVPSPIPELRHVVEAKFLESFLRNVCAIRPTQVDTSGPATMPLTGDIRNPVQQVCFLDDLFIAINVAGVTSALMANLKQLLSLAPCQHHVLRRLQAVRHFLLAVDMKAFFKAGDGVLGMPKIRSGDQHRIQILLLLKHLLIIDISRSLMAEPAVGFKGTGDTAKIALFPDVANCTKFNTRIFTEL